MFQRNIILLVYFCPLLDRGTDNGFSVRLIIILKSDARVGIEVHSGILVGPNTPLKPTVLTLCGICRWFVFLVIPHTATDYHWEWSKKGRVSEKGKVGVVWMFSFSFQTSLQSLSP